jgi:peptidoglycan/xylan/chitin deacetylase (PgdA/CDA1 family)/glyoxylase-like metal-dependent hydrolase (beta-lactamase superfamily II)
VLWIWLLACPKAPPTAPLSLAPVEATRAALGPGDVQVSFTGTLAYAGHFATPDHTETWAVSGDTTVTPTAVQRTWRMPEVGWTEVTRGDTLTERLEAAAPWPGPLLDELLASPADVRVLSDDTVLWSADGLWTLTLDDGLPTRLERSRAHPVFGDVRDVLTWTDWSPVGDHLVPGRWTLELAGDDTRYAVQAERTTVGRAPALAPPDPLSSRELQPGTWAVSIPAADARSLVVAEGTEGLLFDPPLSSDLGAQLLDTARRLAPEVEQWAVVVSHHHPHYTGGLRPFARAGIPIVVHPDLVGWVTELLQQPRALDPTDPGTPTPDVTTSTTLAGVELITLGAASEHTDSYLVASFADRGLLYAADLLSFPDDGPPRRRAGVAAVLDRVPDGVNQAFSAWPLDGTVPTGPLRDAPLQVALTFDDLPSQTLAPGRPTVDDPDEQRVMSERILATLDAHDASATVFVNCGHLGDQDDTLALWRDAGMEVGNHTHTHVNVNRVDLDEWTEDVTACDRLLREAGTEPRYFRYPYLRRGPPEIRDAGAAVLAELGYRIAPVTAATSEWRLAQLYDEADEAQREVLVEALVDHMVASLRAAAWQVRTRHDLDVPHITLLHVNALQADGLDAVLDRFAREGIEVVPLDEVMQHPWYASRDVQTLDRSLPWQLRIVPPLGRGEPNWFDDAQQRIEDRFAPHD